MVRKRMNPGLQEWNLERMMNRDTLFGSGGARHYRHEFDIHAHMDRSLRLDENIRNIRQLTGQQSQGHRERYSRQPTRQDTRGSHYQTGFSDFEADRVRRAKIPGTRYSASGRYTERRKNRSDRPGHST